MHRSCASRLTKLQGRSEVYTNPKTVCSQSVPGLGYLQDCLLPVESAHPTNSSRKHTFQIPSLKKCHLVGPRKYIFSVAILAFCNDLLCHYAISPTLQAFKRQLKSIVFPSAWVNMSKVIVLFGEIQGLLSF